jgi:GNAT superfamily N-acetyltransferase
MITTGLVTPADRDGLTALLRELASSDPTPRDEAAPGRVAAELSEPSGRVGPFCLLARSHGKAVGFAAFTGLLPVTDGRWGLFLQLLFITEAARGGGAARALMAGLARFAQERGYARLDWQAVPENRRAIGLYASLGAPIIDRTYYRLDGERLAAAARIWPESIR